MAFIHPDRTRNLGSARAPDERGFPVKSRAEHSSPVQKRNRKRKWNESHDEQQFMGGGEVTAPNEYAKSARDDRLGSHRLQVQGPEKNAGFDNIRAPRPNALDADRSKRPRVEAPDPSKRKENRRPTNRGVGRRDLDAEKLERARHLAPNYSDLRDIEAWRELGQNNKRSPQAEHAFVYRQLRFDQRPGGLALKEWKIRVHREMEQLGLEDAYTGPLVRKAPDGEVKDEAMRGVTQEAVETVEDEHRRREMERMIADDGLDIDIYGDEETRRKYEPWVRSRMDRT